MTIRYGASLSLLAQLATKVALIISGVSPNKPLREIGGWKWIPSCPNNSLGSSKVRAFGIIEQS